MNKETIIKAIKDGRVWGFGTRDEGLDGIVYFFDIEREDKLLHEIQTDKETYQDIIRSQTIRPDFF